MALFEGLTGAPLASLSAGIAPPIEAVVRLVPSYAELPITATAEGAVCHDKIQILVSLERIERNYSCKESE
jgi:hypothetical protein